MGQIGPGFLSLPYRTPKPRSDGLTHVLDKGLSLFALESLIQTAGDAIDIVKLGWGTSYVSDGVKAKVGAVPRGGHPPLARAAPCWRSASTRAGSPTTCGGCSASASPTSRCPTARSAWTPSRKRALIRMLARDFTVLSECGSKNPNAEVVAADWVAEMAGDLEAGATLLIAEARESGTVGLYLPDGRPRAELVDALVHELPVEKIIFEAPRKDQQAWFIRRLGPSASLGNIPSDEVVALETLRLGLRSDTLDLLPDSGEHLLRRRRGPGAAHATAVPLMEDRADRGTILLPTTMVGSWPRPLWLRGGVLRESPYEVDFPDMYQRTLYEDAVRLAVKDQDLAGLDIVTDGNQYFEGETPYDKIQMLLVPLRLHGFRGYGPPGAVPGMEQYFRPVVHDRVRWVRPVFGPVLGAVKIATDKPFKININAGPGDGRHLVRGPVVRRRHGAAGRRRRRVQPRAALARRPRRRRHPAHRADLHRLGGPRGVGAGGDEPRRARRGRAPRLAHVLRQRPRVRLRLSRGQRRLPGQAVRLGPGGGLAGDPPGDRAPGDGRDGASWRAGSTGRAPRSASAWSR